MQKKKRTKEVFQEKSNPVPDVQNANVKRFLHRAQAVSLSVLLLLYQIANRVAELAFT